jgi:hypothetical protein
MVITSKAGQGAAKSELLVGYCLDGLSQTQLPSARFMAELIQAVLCDNKWGASLFGSGQESCASDCLVFRLL